MASYRYLREIKTEEPSAPAPEPEKKDKVKNWWHYNKIKVISAVVLLFIIIYFFISTVFQTRPDYTIGIISSTALPNELTLTLSEQLKPYLDDKNGDGEVVVTIINYVLTPPTDNSSENSSISQSETPQNASVESSESGPLSQGYLNNDQIVGFTKLTGTLASPDDFIFLLAPEYAQEYQDAYAIFGYPDGTIAPEGVSVDEISYLFKDCPTLANLNLTYTDIYDEEHDGFSILEDYSIGLRPVIGTQVGKKEKAMQNWESNKKIYEKLTQGATA